MNPLRVLLVDEEEEFVLTLVERLQLRGVTAKGVTSGKEAMELLQRERFDVVVADLKMPGIDGLEILKLVQQEFPQTKVILVTGHGGQEEQEYGDLEIMMKPFDIDALVQRFAAVSLAGER